MSKNPAMRFLQTEPVRTAGIVAGIAIFLLARYAHVNANLATQIAGLLVPAVLAELARTHATPTVTAGDATAATGQFEQLQQQVADLQALGLGGAAGKVVADALQAALSDAAAVLQDGFDQSLDTHRAVLDPHVAALEQIVTTLEHLTGQTAGLTSAISVPAAPVNSAPVAASPASGLPAPPTVTLPTAGSPQTATVGTRDVGVVPLPAPVASAPASPPARTAPPMWKG